MFFQDFLIINSMFKNALDFLKNPWRRDIQFLELKRESFFGLPFIPNFL